MHWSDGYYGELYRRSVADLLTPRLSALEAEVIAALLAVRPGGRVLDLACGFGRHAWPLAARGVSVVGLERDAADLRSAAAAGPGGGAGPGGRAPAWLRADLRALPLRTGAFDAAFSWYASLFMFDDAQNAACLAALAAVVRPGGRVLVHHANPLRLARAPLDTAWRALADGSRVEETSEFDPQSGLDRCTRTVTRPDGRVLAGTAELRYYTPSEWRRLSHQAGLRLVLLTSTTEAGRSPPPELGPEAPDLIALLETPT